MVVHRKMQDAFVQHKIDLERYTKHETAEVARLLEKHDRRLVKMLRERMPHLAATSDIHRARTQALMGRVREMRLAAMRDALNRTREDMLALGKVEAEVVSRTVAKALPLEITFNPVRAAAMRQAVTGQPFAGGQHAARTLKQWFNDLAAADRSRLQGAIQLGVRRQETVDTMVRRIAGTRANNYTDGLLAITRRQAETAVRTAVNHVNNAAQLEWGQANSDVCPGWQWVAMLDERLCPLCQANRGKFVPNGDGKPPEGMEVAEGTPPLHPNDRCTIVPVLDPGMLARRVPDRMEMAA